MKPDDRSRLLESMVNCAARGGAVVWDHFNSDVVVERKVLEYLPHLRLALKVTPCR